MHDHCHINLAFSNTAQVHSIKAISKLIKYTFFNHKQEIHNSDFTQRLWPRGPLSSWAPGPGPGRPDRQAGGGRPAQPSPARTAAISPDLPDVDLTTNQQQVYFWGEKKNRLEICKKTRQGNGVW